jgi:hypothetical protein
MTGSDYDFILLFSMILIAALIANVIMLWAAISRLAREIETICRLLVGLLAEYDARPPDGLFED